MVFGLGRVQCNSKGQDMVFHIANRTGILHELLKTASKEASLIKRTFIL